MLMIEIRLPPLHCVGADGLPARGLAKAEYMLAAGASSPGLSAARRSSQRYAMTAVETELEMATRHVAEQLTRIAKQEVLIARNGRSAGQDLLESMREHVARLSA
jgi:hypothetical protein